MRDRAFRSHPIAAAIFVCALAIFVVGLRIPFLSNYLASEEGYFATLVASPTPSSQASGRGVPSALMASINGREWFTGFLHAVIPYDIIETAVGGVIRRVDVRSMSFENRTRVIRAGFLVLFMLGAAGLLYSSFCSLTQQTPLVWRLSVATFPIYVLTTPLAVGASIQAQVDGSVGVLLTGLAGLLLVSADKQSPWWVFSLAGFLIGIGRTEWVLGILVVLIALVACGALFGERPHRVAGAVAVGVLLGFALSALRSHSEFKESFFIIGRMIGTTDVMGTAKKFFRFTAPLLIVLMASSAISLLHIHWLLRERPGILIAQGLGAAIFVGFTLGGWPADNFPRYFAPALVLISYAFVATLLYAPIISKRIGAAAGAALMAFGFFLNFDYLWTAHEHYLSITSAPGWPMAQEVADQQTSAEVARKTGAIVIESPSFWLYYPDLDYVTDGVGPEYYEMLRSADPNIRHRLLPRKIR